LLAQPLLQAVQAVAQVAAPVAAVEGTPTKMRTLHVADKSTVLPFLPKIAGIHYLDLDGTNVLVSLPYDDDEFLKHPKVESLPHPLSLKSIASHPHFELLKEKLGAAENDSTFDLAERARKIHPLVRL
jgi:hypothetical protein